MPSPAILRRLALLTATAAAAAAMLSSLFAAAPAAAGNFTVDYCPYIPVMASGIPPWGFHTGSPITGPTGSYARGHGDISLAANSVSGEICKVDRNRTGDHTVVLTVLPHLGFHSHYAYKWGYEGNIMHISVRVRRSINDSCPVGTIGHVTLYGSYNGVRSDSVQFFFPKSCASQNHLYHGPQVNDQVPPDGPNAPA